MVTMRNLLLASLLLVAAAAAIVDDPEEPPVLSDAEVCLANMARVKTAAAKEDWAEVLALEVPLEAVLMARLEEASPESHAEMLLAFATAHALNKTHVQAAQHFTQLIAFSQDSKSKGEAAHGLATALAGQGLHSEAFPWFEQALMLAEEEGEDVSRVRALHGLAGVHARSGRLDEGIQALRDAATITTEKLPSQPNSKEGKEEMELQTLAHLGVVLLMKKYYEEAGPVVERLVEAAKEKSVRLERPCREELLALRVLSRYHTEKKNMSEAADAARAVLEIAKEDPEFAADPDCARAIEKSTKLLDDFEATQAKTE